MIIGILLVSLSLIIWQDFLFSLAIFLGATLAFGNFWLLKLLLTKMLSTMGQNQAGGSSKTIGYAFFVLLKFVILLGTLAIFIGYFKLDAIALALGFGSLPLAITVGSFYQMLKS